MKIAIIEDNEFQYPDDSFFYKVLISEILERNLTPNQFKLFIYITNKTLGFKKQWDFIAKFKLEEQIQSSRQTTDKALKFLEENKLIVVYRNPSKRKSNTTARYNAYSLGSELLDSVYLTYEEVTDYKE